MSTHESKADEVLDFSSQGVTRSKGRPPDTQMNLDQLKVDELCYLKKSKSGYLGYLNRIYKEMEILMLDPCNLDSVITRKQTLDSAHDKCLHIHEKYFRALDDVTEKRDVLQTHENLIRHKDDFDNRYRQWVKQSKSARSPPTSLKGRRDPTGKTPLRTAFDTRSMEGVTQNVGQLQSRLERLTRRHELQCQIAEIKTQQLKVLEEIKQKEAEIEREMTMLEVESDNEIPRMRLDGKDEWKSDKSVLMTPSCFELKWTDNMLPQPKPKTSTPYNRMDVDALDEKDDQYSPKSSPKESRLPAHVLSTSDSVERKDLEFLLKQQQEAMSLMASSLRVGFEMPKKELLTFDGNPINYWTFIKNFEINIERQLSDADSKLTYLIQQCTGKARESIKNCIIISDKETAYKRAKEILHSRYGQKHVIAHAYINRLVTAPQLKTTDSTGLTELASQMQNCQLTLTSMGFEADVNSSGNLVRVVKRLPVHLQSKWADKAGSLITQGIEPTFEHLTKFVDERAILGNTMYWHDSRIDSRQRQP